MTVVRSFRDLRVWQRGVDLVCLTYAISRRLPKEERFALGGQMRRAATSIPANIAEGHTRLHRKEYLHFLSIAHGSLSELHTHLTVAERVGYIDADDAAPALAVCDELGRMLTALKTRLGEK